MVSEEYQSSLTEDQKNILDDAPDQVVEHLMRYQNNNGNPPFFNLRVKDKLTGNESFVKFENVDVPNAFDYLRYLMRNGIRTDYADAV